MPRHRWVALAETGPTRSPDGLRSWGGLERIGANVNDTLLIALLAIPVVVTMAGLVGRLVALEDPSWVEDGDTMRSS